MQNVTAYVDELEQQIINRMMTQQAKAQEQAQQAQAQGQGQPMDQQAMVDAQKAQIELQAAQEKRMMNQEAHQQKMETIRQQMALADLKTRTNIIDKASQNPTLGGRPPMIEQAQ